VELQSRYAEITRQGLGLIAISYDSADTLRKFSSSRGISFPMIADAGSAIIKRYGLFNDTVDPKSATYGIPHPGTFIVDRKGVVVSRFFEDVYQERNTTATILTTLGTKASAVMQTSTAHLSMTASISDTTAAPGERLAVIVDVRPLKGMHLYAPGKHDYKVVQLTLDAQPLLRAHDTRYPASEIYHFKPLNERVEVYAKPFQLRREFTLLATPDAQKQLGAMTSITITGALEYQACDDKVCFNPARVPISFTLSLKGLDPQTAWRLVARPATEAAVQFRRARLEAAPPRPEQGPHADDADGRSPSTGHAGHTHRRGRAAVRMRFEIRRQGLPDGALGFRAGIGCRENG
jgi:DsbC/DsbD-like thiol-disulfide interchange protein